MRFLLTILCWLVGVLILGQLFVWFLALGSGHNLPQATQTAFLQNLIVLIIIGVSGIFWVNVPRNRHK